MKSIFKIEGARQLGLLQWTATFSEFFYIAVLSTMPLLRGDQGLLR